MPNFEQVVTARDLPRKAGCDLIQTQGLCESLWPLHHRGARDKRTALSSKVLSGLLFIFSRVNPYLGPLRHCDKDSCASEL